MSGVLFTWAALERAMTEPSAWQAKSMGQTGVKVAPPAACSKHVRERTASHAATIVAPSEGRWPVRSGLAQLDGCCEGAFALVRPDWLDILEWRTSNRGSITSNTWVRA